MYVDAKSPIGKIAGELSGAMAVFESLGIDYSCAGDLSLEDAAHVAGLDPETLIRQLTALANDQRLASWNDRPLSDLTRHLVDQHHRFVRDELASIALRLSDVCAPPIRTTPDLLALRTACTRLADVVLPHLHHEERTLFREIDAIEEAWQSNEPPQIDGDLRVRIRETLGEHGTINAQLKAIRDLRQRLAESEDLHPRCRAILQSIAGLEAHLHEYMFLENCVLLPRALALDEQMTATTR